MRCAVITVVFAAVVARYILVMYNFLGFDVDLSGTFDDHTCRLLKLPGTLSSEDMAIGKQGTLFITSGDLHHVFEHGTAGAKPGGLWAFDLADAGAKPRRLAMNGFDDKEVRRTRWRGCTERDSGETERGGEREREREEASEDEWGQRGHFCSVCIGDTHGSGTQTHIDRHRLK